MLSTRLPPVIAMCASCGVVMMRSVLKRPCDLISSSVWETSFSNSGTIAGPQITQIQTDNKNESARTPSPADVKGNGPFLFSSSYRSLCPLWSLDEEYASRLVIESSCSGCE